MTHIGCWLARTFRQYKLALQTRAKKPTVLHVRGRWCPPGYRRVKNLFIEADGSKQDAYVADWPHETQRLASGSVSFDYLLPDESLSLGLQSLNAELEKAEGNVRDIVERYQQARSGAGRQPYVLRTTQDPPR